MNVSIFDQYSYRFLSITRTREEGCCSFSFLFLAWTERTNAKGQCQVFCNSYCYQATTTMLCRCVLRFDRFQYFSFWERYRFDLQAVNYSKVCQHLLFSSSFSDLDIHSQSCIRHRNNIQTENIWGANHFISYFEFPINIFYCLSVFFRFFLISSIVECFRHVKQASAVFGRFSLIFSIFVYIQKKHTQTTDRILCYFHSTHTRTN